MDAIEIKQITAVTPALIADINAALDDKTWDMTSGEAFLADKNAILFISYYENKPAGFIYGYYLQRFDEKKAEILLYEIAVNEVFRQKGIAKAMIESLKKWAHAKGAFEMWVLTNRSNAAGMRLYTSAGGTIESDDEQMFTFSIL